MKTYLLIFAGVIGCSLSCSKPEEETSCLSDRETAEVVINREATVVASGNPGQFLIIPENSIDSRFRPCNLPEAFRVDDLQVVVSGESKSSIQFGPEPCCTNNFVIRSIRRK